MPSNDLKDTETKPAKAPQSLASLKGVGKELWQGEDAQAYVDELRDKPAAEVREDLGPHKTLPPEDFDRLASDLYSERPKEWWILRTPAGEFLDNDEPMKMDWSLCSKTHVIEYSAYQAVRAERDEQQGYAIKFQREADQLRRELEKCESESYRCSLLALDAHNHAVDRMRKLTSERDEARAEVERLSLRIGREDLLREMLTNSQAECERLRATWEQDHQVREKNMANYIAKLKGENERLREACKRNPSSGSCIEALSGSGASGRADT